MNSSYKSFAISALLDYEEKKLRYALPALPVLISYLLSSIMFKRDCVYLLDSSTFVYT